MKRKCKVCGARVKAWDDRIDTCDSTCRRAKIGGRTRAAQIRFEIRLEAEHAALEDPTPTPCIYTGGNLELSNRPYLSEAYA